MQIQLRHALESAQSPQLRLDRLDAQWLMLHALGKTQDDRAWLLTHDDELLAQPVLDVFRRLCERRAGGEPLAYIVGYKAFFGLDFAVDPRVLVPRPDTETLVQWGLDVIGALDPKPIDDSNGHSPCPPQILDLGTGSGAVAIALAHSLKQASHAANVFAIDASAGALAVAAANAHRLQVEVSFSASNWLAQVSGRYDLIVSNPPYIAETDTHLDALKHEPLAALTAGTEGLDDIRQIITSAPAHLFPGGWLLLEHGYDQALKVRTLLHQAGFEQIESRLDLAGIERCSGGRRPV